MRFYPLVTVTFQYALNSTAIVSYLEFAGSMNFNFYENFLASYIVVQTIQAQITKRIILGVPDNPLIAQLLCIYFFYLFPRYCPSWLAWLPEACVAWEASNSNTNLLNLG